MKGKKLNKNNALAKPTSELDVWFVFQSANVSKAMSNNTSANLGAKGLDKAIARHHLLILV